MGATKKRYRPDQKGPYSTLYEANRKIVLATQTLCGICGKPVDKTLPASDPMSATVDHIIPIARNGHPSDLSNLQLAHRACNRMKSDKLNVEAPPPPKKIKTMLDWHTQ